MKEAPLEPVRVSALRLAGGRLHRKKVAHKVALDQAADATDVLPVAARCAAHDGETYLAAAYRGEVEVHGEPGHRTLAIGVRKTHDGARLADRHGVQADH